MKQNRVLEHYNWTIQTAINKAVELTKNQNKDLHAEIIIRDTGIVSVSKLSTYFFTLFVNSKIIAIVCVYGWQENIIDVKNKTQEVEEEIKKNNLVGNSLYPQKN